MTIYQQARDIIIKDDQLTQPDKIKYLKSLENKMLEKLYSPEEVAQFKQMLNNIVMIMPGGVMKGKGRLINSKNKLISNKPQPSSPPEKGSSWW